MLPNRTLQERELLRRVINVIGEIGSVPTDERKNGRTKLVHPVQPR